MYKWDLKFHKPGERGHVNYGIEGVVHTTQIQYSHSEDTAFNKGINNLWRSQLF